jgi:UDP-glucuronate decarboxylase
MALDDGRVVSNFIAQALRGTPLTIFGDGEQTRSFCYVDDLLDGVLAMSRVAAVSSPVNLGNPTEFTILELARHVAELAGARVAFAEAPLPSDDPRRRKPDITRARQLLGFEPRVPLREGLLRTIEDFRGRLSATGPWPRAA